MSGEFAGKAKFGMINVDESKIGNDYGVAALPTTVVIKNGKVADKIVGADTEGVRSALEKALL